MYGLPRWVSALLVLNILGVTFAIVYTGDHYVIDAVAGVAYSLAAWMLVRRLEDAPAPRRFEEPRSEPVPVPAIDTPNL
jgi:hypothetical protein